MQSIWKWLTATLRRLCRALGPRPQRRRPARPESAAETAEAPAAPEPAPALDWALDWPAEWTDRHGNTRQCEQPEAFVDKDGALTPADRKIRWISAYQIRAVTGARMEHVLNYPLLPGPDARGGNRDTLPDWWRHDEYYRYFVTEAQARRIVERIRRHTARHGARS